jgi:hypothetical protein
MYGKCKEDIEVECRREENLLNLKVLCCYFASCMWLKYSLIFSG